MKTTVIYHSADFDGIFCREIARKFLPEATNFIGWNFGDPPVKDIPAGVLYIMDLPVDKVLGLTNPSWIDRSLEHGQTLIWIDHHKTAIDTHPKDIPGTRIDGVAACRLAYQWFLATESPEPVMNKPTKQDFVDRTVSEPLAVRLAGEYDIWDKRDSMAELFQHGLRSEPIDFQLLLQDNRNNGTVRLISRLLDQGRAIAFARDQEYKDVITDQGFDLEMAGIKFLACNSHECDIRSQLFEAGIKPHHQALMGFTWTGKQWRVSLYRIPGQDIDILNLAKAHGGGGHAGACGFMVDNEGFIFGMPMRRV